MTDSTYFKSLVPTINRDGVDGFVLGDFYNAVLRIDNEADAARFFDSYEAFIEQTPKPPGVDKKGQPYASRSSHEVALKNIGWVFGEGMTPARVAMWVAATDARHPIFGPRMPEDPVAAFKAGLELGKA